MILEKITRLLILTRPDQITNLRQRKRNIRKCRLLRPEKQRIVIQYYRLILDITEGKTQAPPPPPKPKMKQIEMKKPPALKPQFKINNAAKIDPKFTPNFKVMSSFDADVSAPDFSMMAQNYSVKSFSIDQSQISNVTTDILKAIGVGDLMDDGRGTKVSGVGKRMRARLNLCLMSTPGATIIGNTGYYSSFLVYTR